MATGIGPKRLVVGAHYGLKDWLAQRITALYMAFYAAALLVASLCVEQLDYATWVSFFNFECAGIPLGKMAAVLGLLAMTYHIWIGIRDIWMDYVKPAGIRLGLQVLTVMWLLAALVYGLQVLWRV